MSPTPAPRAPTEPVPQAPALWIETTAYALLHLLLREGKGEMADKAASWLTHQGSFEGGFRSTQVGQPQGGFRSTQVGEPQGRFCSTHQGSPRALGRRPGIKCLTLA